MQGCLGAPQHVVRHHPPVGQVYTLLKLHSDHFGVHLYHNPLQPIAHALMAVLVIAKNFYPVADIIQFVPVWCGGEIQFSQNCLPMHVLVHLLQNSLLETLPDAVKWDALHDGVKEAFHHKPFSIRISDSTAE